MGSGVGSPTFFFLFFGGVDSPDMADALGLTYSEEISSLMSLTIPGMRARPNEALHEYDPMNEDW